MQTDRQLTHGRFWQKSDTPEQNVAQGVAAVNLHKFTYLCGSSKAYEQGCGRRNPRSGAVVQDLPVAGICGRESRGRAPEDAPPRGPPPAPPDPAAAHIPHQLCFLFTGAFTGSQ